MLKKICNVLSVIVLIILAAIAALLFVPKIIGYGQYAVLSGSMEPNIHVGEVVIDKPFDPDEIDVGTVITYQISADTLVTHRIVAIDADNEVVTTKGDANDAEDASPVSYDNILGIYAFNVPYLGYISIYSKTPLGIAAICGVLVVVILLNFIPDILEEDKKEKEEKKKENEK